MTFVLMSLATYRFTRLVVEDTFPPALWLRSKLAGAWVPVDTAREEILVDTEMINGEPYRYVERADWSPFWLAKLIDCAYCASGWIAMGTVAVFSQFVSVSDPVFVWPAVWAVGGWLAAQKWA